MRKRKFIILIIAILLMLLFIYFKNKNVNISSFNKMETKNSLSNQIQDENEKIEISLNDNIIYNNVLKLKAKIENFNDKNVYNICCELNGISLEKINVISENAEISCNLTDVEEGKNIIKTSYYVNEKKIGDLSFEIFYIKPYTKQFLDELSNIGFSTHFGYMYNQDNQKDINLLNKMGCFNVRDDIRFNLLNRTNALEWVNMLNENNMKLYAIIMPQLENEFGKDKIVNSDMELDVYKEILKKVIEKIDAKVYKYEMYNEPNWTIYTKENIKWYSKQTEETIKLVNKNKKPSDIIIGSTCASGVADNKISSLDFLNEVENNNIYKYNVGISYHSYDYYQSLDLKHQELLEKHSNFINEQGGFQNLYVSEYGVDTSNYGKTEEYQAMLLIRQTVYNNMKSVKNSYIYSFRDMGFDKNNAENYYGVITHDYKPKLAYYALKNYYENTNGSEYIGTINLEEGLETHIYDKDGKPKIITWSNNTKKDITIPYENFTAKDIYGNEIKNENGELAITTSPIYLDNIEEKYFYQAISNTATTKYTEFEEKFAEEIEKLPEIKQQTKNLKQQIEQIGKTETRIDEQTAKTLMQRHFQLGNSLINAYQNRRIETEKVKLSSMLDMLNDIGNSYEDLVTVTAKTRNADISQAKDLVKEVENIITSNSDIEIVYPAKILEFSKDYQEKAEYINGLEEENDIKTGLIVSKNLHSIYLSNWAKEFTNIYIDEYLKNNLIAENYSEKNITNQDVTVTLNIGDDTKITNNNGSNQYIFKEKGEYTFEYERRGRNFRQTVKVENIDKQSPKITGVEEGQVYENKIKPIIEDENLETVRLIQDGRVIDNYINNAEIKEEGMYRIEAIDKAGNKTITSFEIIENISKEYIIENNIIKNIEANTTVEQFKENIKIQTEYNIQREGQTLEAKEKIATGDILQIGDTQYTLIVRGDIDKDSKITIKDLILLRQQIIGEKTLEDTAKTAGDIDLNKKIDARDIVKLRKLILTNNQ